MNANPQRRIRNKCRRVFNDSRIRKTVDGQMENKEEGGVEQPVSTFQGALGHPPWRKRGFIVARYRCDRASSRDKT